MQLSDELVRLFTQLSRLSADHQRGALLIRLEYVVLARLHRDGPMRAGDLAQRDGLEPSTLSRRLAALEERGLLTREPDAGDRRATLLHLTDAGRSTFLAEQNRRVELITGAVAAWPAVERDEFVRLLARLNDALQNRISS